MLAAAEILPRHQHLWCYFHYYSVTLLILTSEMWTLRYITYSAVTEWTDCITSGYCNIWNVNNSLIRTNFTAPLLVSGIIVRVHCIHTLSCDGWLLRLLVITFLSQLAETAALLVVCECGLECPLVAEQSRQWRRRMEWVWERLCCCRIVPTGHCCEWESE